MYEGCIRPSRLLGPVSVVAWEGRGWDTSRSGRGRERGGRDPIAVRERGNRARGGNAKAGWGQTRRKRKTSPLGLSSAISREEEEVNILRVFLCGMEWNASRKRGRQKKESQEGTNRKEEDGAQKRKSFSLLLLGPNHAEGEE